MESRRKIALDMWPVGELKSSDWGREKLRQEDDRAE